MSRNDAMQTPDQEKKRNFRVDFDNLSLFISEWIKVQT